MCPILQVDQRHPLVSSTAALITRPVDWLWVSYDSLNVNPFMSHRTQGTLLVLAMTPYVY